MIQLLIPTCKVFLRNKLNLCREVEQQKSSKEKSKGDQEKEKGKEIKKEIEGRSEIKDK